MLLSIVMMIKNEEKYLDNTLKSLEPLMKDINSELIILDTGSTDRSIEIARKYTEKVYFEKWNDDFAYMRNVSISYASGEWILILDADEELVNYNKLLGFLDSSLCNKYNSATINLKNIFSEDYRNYSISHMIRFFKNNEKLRYYGAIHEQPVFELPIYNDIAEFNHFGYLFEDLDIAHLKCKRNEKILIKEINENPDDPYINYQLGKNHMVLENYAEAIYYMERAYKLYEKNKFTPVFVVQELASLYIELKEFGKCEKLCSSYIKRDNRNIDIYFYIATSQMNLNQYNQSIENYNRYLYLLENYNMSTQANRIDCNLDTMIFKKDCIVNTIKNYYKLGQYKKIIECIDDFDIEILRKSYKYVFMSLVKLNKHKKIKQLYKQSLESKIEKTNFEKSLEDTLKLLTIEDKMKIYQIISEFDNNYGILNQLRLGKNLSIDKYKEILKNENKDYFADVLYFSIYQNLDVIQIMYDLNILQIQDTIEYLMKTRKSCVFDFYNIMQESENTLDLKKMKIYSCICKSLLKFGGLSKSKYEFIFDMYKYYEYEFILKIYNQDLKEEYIIQYFRTKEEEFIFKINLLNSLKKHDKVTFLKEMNNLLIQNLNYKKGIEILIERFEKDFNQNEELKKLKIQYKCLIEKSINFGEIQDASTMIFEYESLFGDDPEVLNMKSIIFILDKDISNAENMLKRSLILDNTNVNTFFNIATIKEIKKDEDEAKKFYEKSFNICNDEKLKLEIIEKIDNLKK